MLRVLFLFSGVFYATLTWAQDATFCPEPHGFSSEKDIQELLIKINKVKIEEVEKAKLEAKENSAEAFFSLKERFHCNNVRMAIAQALGDLYRKKIITKDRAIKIAKDDILMAAMHVNYINSFSQLKILSMLSEEGIFSLAPQQQKQLVEAKKKLVSEYEPIKKTQIEFLKRVPKDFLKDRMKAIAFIKKQKDYLSFSVAMQKEIKLSQKRVDIISEILK